MNVSFGYWQNSYIYTSWNASLQETDFVHLTQRRSNSSQLVNLKKQRKPKVEREGSRRSNRKEGSQRSRNFVDWVNLWKARTYDELEEVQTPTWRTIFLWRSVRPRTNQVRFHQSSVEGSSRQHQRWSICEFVPWKQDTVTITPKAVIATIRTKAWKQRIALCIHWGLA